MRRRNLFAKALLVCPGIAIPLLAAVSAMAADFDGDGAPDEFTVTRDAAKVAKEPGVKVSNPWAEQRPSKKSPKGVGLVIRLTRTPQNFLVHDAEFFSSPMWIEGKPAVRVITKKDKQYKDWKKQVPALRGDAIELGTEAGIDILLYWDGRWRLFWPDEEP
ncbi:MAG TPA: hypothetical protein VM940_13765 [Chthoniobacterales bacterium]|jgi:hypothetical protein|nr:hypothetical protein [Chthoniobacterales bacterium]